MIGCRPVTMAAYCVQRCAMIGYKRFVFGLKVIKMERSRRALSPSYAGRRSEEQQEDGRLRRSRTGKFDLYNLCWPKGSGPRTASPRPV